MGATKVRGEEGLLAIFLHIQLFFIRIVSFCISFMISHCHPLPSATPQHFFFCFWCDPPTILSGPNKAIPI